ncbi:MAG: hypothetical protein U1E70_22130 [Acetobacteraceae bacterium]|nr:hypothetical protein [Pseudomonadota bacterium]
MQSQGDAVATVIGAFVPLLIIGLIAAIILAKLAPRVGASPVAWFILSLIPVVNLFFFYYAGYRIIAHILDRLNDLSTRQRAN